MAAFTVRAQPARLRDNLVVHVIKCYVPSPAVTSVDHGLQQKRRGIRPYHPVFFFRKPRAACRARDVFGATMNICVAKMLMLSVTDANDY